MTTGAQTLMQKLGQAGILKKKNGANKDTVITSED